MESQRQQKIARLIQKDLGTLFQREGSGMFDGAMITVTKVNITGDLSLARVYLSLFATKDKDELLMTINKKRKNIRYRLASKIRHQLRSVPELEFYIDDSLDYIENIENLLKK
ncbi:MAG: 30S ribosome-binding factor RbfA [Bacteroidetes bacterium]|nr:30S ribosome-binding factor RbfA [Bacteroidota bacterium]